MKIGVVLESFKKPLEQSLAIARRLGIEGVQIYATFGELEVDSLTPKKVLEIKHMLCQEGIVLAALCGDLGCSLFYEPLQNQALFEKEKRILILAKELGTNIVTTHIGVVPQDTCSEKYKIMTDVCHKLATFADSTGGHFAIETGPEPAKTLKAFLDQLGSRGVAVNLDPANLVMCAGDNPTQAVHILKDYIVHTHAKDGIMLQKTDTRRIYDARHNGVDPIVYDEYFKELPLGEGGVDFVSYLHALTEIGYDGYLTIEREVGAVPENDIAHACSFLKSKLAKN